MKDKPPTPLQASFWLTPQEQKYILVVCTIFLIGLIARYFYLKNEKNTLYTPAHITPTEHPYE
jgi:hypothetical protein